MNDFIIKPAKQPNKPRVALVCDWLTGGGAERVMKALHQIYPDAPIYTSYASPAQRRVFDTADVRTSGFLQTKLGGKLRKFLPILRERYFEKLDLGDYDIVISASGAEAKGVKVGEGTLHINYCHSPTHYYWVRYDEYVSNPGFGYFNPIARLGLRILVASRRKWDRAAAQRPHIIIANSSVTRDRIAEYYGRESTVIFPPVDVEHFGLNTKHKRIGFVIAGRQTMYKRFDLAVEVCSKLNLPLKVVGDGPEHKTLRSIAGPNVEFFTNVSDTEMVHHFQTAEAFLFPGLEDFGITPVEAMACGTPVLAYKAGGALDYVVPGLSGDFFAQQTAASLRTALRDFDASTYEPQAIRAHAEKFSTQKFAQAIHAFVDNEYAAFSDNKQ